MKRAQHVRRALTSGALLLMLAAISSWVYEDIPNPVDATGEVVARQHQSSGGGRGDRYRFIVQYRVGKSDFRFSFSRPVYEMFKEYPVGSGVAIRYDHNHPDHAVLARWDYAHPLTMTFLLLLCFDLGTLLWFTRTQSGQDYFNRLESKNANRSKR